MFVLLSFPLATDTPTPGGRTPLTLRVDESLAQGHVGNTFFYTAWNHAGTHVDGPAHMLAEGHKVSDFPIERFIFQHPRLIEVPKGNDELITAADLRPYKAAIAEADLLLLRTDFTRYRRSEPLRYRDRNPGLSAEVAHYLADAPFSSLRAIGIDAISMASVAHLDEGIEAHQILFARQPEGIFLIEDMDLRADLRHLKRIYVVPWFVEGVDSSHCTIIAEKER